jgi:hypothetical protein
MSAKEDVIQVPDGAQVHFRQELSLSGLRLSFAVLLLPHQKAGPTNPPLYNLDQVLRLHPKRQWDRERERSTNSGRADIDP